MSINEIHLRSWDYIYDTRVRSPALQLTSHHSGPLSLSQLFHNTVQAVRVYTHGDRYALKHTVTRRTVWRQQLQPTPTISSPSTSPLLQHLQHSILNAFGTAPITIITDGSWKQTGSATDRALLLATASLGGSSIIIMADQPNWNHHPILSYSIADDQTSPTTCAYPWELMALAIATLLCHSLHQPCRILSDCLSAISTISNITPTAALLDPYCVLLYPVALLSNRPNIAHIAAHPERRHKSAAQWTHDDWGIFLADAAASNPSSLRHHQHLHVHHCSGEPR